MPVKPPKHLQVSAKQLKALQNRIKKRDLADTDWDLLQGLTETVECLSKALGGCPTTQDYKKLGILKLRSDCRTNGLFLK